MTKLRVLAAPGIKLPIPRSLGLSRSGHFPTDVPLRVPNDPYIRRRLAEGSLVLAPEPIEAPPAEPAPPKARKTSSSTTPDSRS